MKSNASIFYMLVCLEALLSLIIVILVPRSSELVAELSGDQQTILRFPTYLILLIPVFLFVVDFLIFLRSRAVSRILLVRNFLYIAVLAVTILWVLSNLLIDTVSMN